MTHRLMLARVILALSILTLCLAGCAFVKEWSQPAPTAVPTLAQDPLEAMQVIEERVSELRGLETLKPVTKAFLTPEELRQRLEEDMDYTAQEARDDVLLYATFDLMSRDVDLYSLLIDLQTEQIAGFYDPETKEMYVIKSSEIPGALERSTFSHEYTHVLQDQHFDLEALGFTDEAPEKDSDSEQDFAVRCLVEGDASLLQQQYMLQYFEMAELQELLDQVQATDSSVLDSTPAVIQESLFFPYEAGLVFVNALYSEGGWDAVDAAYDDLPRSTEQILHRERYPDDVPVEVTLPPLTDTLGSDWRLVDQDVLGEFGLQLYLGVQLSQADTEAAAEGWGGDRYAVYWREDESGFVLALRLVWDTPVDAVEFFTSYVEFAEARFGAGPARTEGEHRLWWSGQDVMLLAQNEQDETLVLIAPDQAMLEVVYTLFPEF